MPLAVKRRESLGDFHPPAAAADDLGIIYCMDESASHLRREFASLVDFQQRESEFEVVSERRRDRYREQLVSFAGIEGDVPSFLLVPDGSGPFPAVLALHQHNSQWPRRPTRGQVGFRPRGGVRVLRRCGA